MSSATMQRTPVSWPHLSTLEQISPQAYVRFILCFGLPSGFTHDGIAQILRQGLEATAAKITILNSLVVPVIDSNGRETKDLRQGDGTLFNVKDLTDSGLDFAQIRSQGFPSQVLDGEMLCSTGIFVASGAPVPVFVAQANFITGGLLLGLSAWHGALDGTAISTTLRLWAQNCCTLQQPNNINSKQLEILSADAFDKSRLSKVSLSEGRTIKDHPEFLLLPETPTALPPGLAKTVKTQIFYMSPASIPALKQLASPSNSTNNQSGYTWISTNTAISALVWKSIMTATYAHQLPVTDTVCRFTSPLDVRKRMNPPLSPDLLASAWCFQDSSLPLKKLLQASLADVGLIVRENMDTIDAKYIDSLIGMIDSTPNPSLLLPLAFTDVLRSCSILTSWAGFRMYDFDWGSSLGGACERVRTVASGMFNGMHVVLPELTKEMGEGLEIVVGLEDDAMERLKGDETWMRFARLL